MPPTPDGGTTKKSKFSRRKIGLKLKIFRAELAIFDIFQAVFAIFKPKFAFSLQKFNFFGEFFEIFGQVPHPIGGHSQKNFGGANALSSLLASP